MLFGYFLVIFGILLGYFKILFVSFLDNFNILLGTFLLGCLGFLVSSHWLQFSCYSGL